MDTKIMKRCTRCEETLPRSEFWHRNTGEVVSRCKDCYRELRNEWQRNNPRKASLQGKRYRARHPEAVIAVKAACRKKKPAL